MAKGRRQRRYQGHPATAAAKFAQDHPDAREIALRKLVRRVSHDGHDIGELVGPFTAAAMHAAAEVCERDPKLAEDADRLQVASYLYDRLVEVVDGFDADDYGRWRTDREPAAAGIGS